MAGKWYVSCAETSTKTFMRIAENREAAIRLAYGMLQHGLSVLEVGPMLEDRNGNIIKAEEIRRIHSDNSQG
jgi:hypothetical protein